jgi:hypothetical protein
LLGLQILFICGSWSILELKKFTWWFWCFCTYFLCLTPLGVEPKHGQILGVRKLCKVGEEKKRGVIQKHWRKAHGFVQRKSPPLFKCKFFKVYQNLITKSPFFGLFYHVKTHVWMIVMV